VREGGEVLATVDTDLACFACALAGSDGRTLFIIAAEWPLAMDGRRTGEVQTIPGGGARGGLSRRSHPARARAADVE
jgi:hypothetical protein